MAPESTREHLKTQRMQACARLFPSLIDPQNFYLVLAQLHSSDIQELSRRLDGLLHLHPNNPTGHFRLNLASADDRTVCEISRNRLLWGWL